MHSVKFVLVLIVIFCFFTATQVSVYALPMPPETEKSSQIMSDESLQALQPNVFFTNKTLAAYGIILSGLGLIGTLIAVPIMFIPPFGVMSAVAMTVSIIFVAGLIPPIPYFLADKPTNGWEHMFWSQLIALISSLSTVLYALSSSSSGTGYVGGGFGALVPASIAIPIFAIMLLFSMFTTSKVSSIDSLESITMRLLENHKLLNRNDLLKG